MLGPTCTTPRLVGGGSGNETLVCQAEVRFVLVTEVSTRTWPFPSSTRTAMVASNPPPDPAISSGLPTRSLARGWSRRKLSDMNGTPSRSTWSGQPFCCTLQPGTNPSTSHRRTVKTMEDFPTWRCRADDSSTARRQRRCLGGSRSCRPTVLRSCAPCVARLPSRLPSRERGRAGRRGRRTSERR